VTGPTGGWADNDSRKVQKLRKCKKKGGELLAEEVNPFLEIGVRESLALGIVRGSYGAKNEERAP